MERVHTQYKCKCLILMWKFLKKPARIIEVRRVIDHRFSDEVTAKMDFTPYMEQKCKERVSRLDSAGGQFSLSCYAVADDWKSPCPTTTIIMTNKKNSARTINFVVIMNKLEEGLPHCNCKSKWMQQQII